MKKINSRMLLCPALAAAIFAGCNDESGLHEEIDVDALRVLSIYQLKSLETGVCDYKVNVPVSIMNGSDNFEDGEYAVQNAADAQSGILVHCPSASIAPAQGKKASIYLEGATVSRQDGITIIEPADGCFTEVAGTQTFDAVPITADQASSGAFQYMYVSLEGWQVIAEDLDKNYSDGIRIETKEKDTLSLTVLPKASFAGKKVAQGSGKVSGIIASRNGRFTIMPQSEDDIEFSDARIVVLEPNHAFLAWAEGSKIDAFVSEVSSNEMAGAVELPSPANCFVVDAPGTYKFEAKAADGSCPEGIPEGSMIYFKVAKTGGNTVICYVSPEDGKTVLWTWHIWASTTSLKDMSITRESTAADDGVVRSIVMLDRLLGATSTVPGDLKALGLVYQWGRKDPIIGAGIKGAWSKSGDNDIPSGSDRWVDGSFDGTAKSVVNTDLFPEFSYIYGTELGEEAQSHLAGAQRATTYIGNSSSSAITGYPSFNDKEWAEIANPCPAGYHVPNVSEAQAILGVSASYSTEGYVLSADGVTPRMDCTDNLGSKLKGLDVWFPNNGNRARNSARYLNLGSRHYAWLDSIDGNSGKCMSIQDNGTASTVNPLNSFNRGNATGIRCVRR